MGSKKRLTTDEKYLLCYLERIGRARNLFDLAVVALEIDYSVAWHAVKRLERFGLITVQHHGKGVPMELEIKQQEER
jgi:predicted MarR family transcription regulator